ncbi:MAG: hypothetical protein AB9891_04870 [Anaerolineaceae bacterium]
MFSFQLDQLPIFVQVVIFLAGLTIAWLLAKWLIRYAVKLVTFLLTVAIAGGIFYLLYYFFIK